MFKKKTPLSDILREGIGYSHREKVVSANEFRMRTDERVSMNPEGQSPADMLGLRGEPVRY